MDGDTEDIKNLVPQTQKFSTGFSIYYELKMYTINKIYKLGGSTTTSRSKKQNQNETEICIEIL